MIEDESLKDYQINLTNLCESQILPRRCCVIYIFIYEMVLNLIQAVSPVWIQASLAETSDFSSRKSTHTSEFLQAVVTISGEKGSGTGFICNFQGKTWVATNQHVLASGGLLSIRTNKGDLITPQRLFAASDADIALIQFSSVSADKPLEIASLSDDSIALNDELIVLGNSKGDGVVTETYGKLLAIGPQRVEVDNPVYSGNSGSPIIHLKSGKVISVLTEARLLKMDEFDKAAFQSKNSAIKSEIRYFGHRIDSIQAWETVDWSYFTQNEALIEQSFSELESIADYLSNSKNYKVFRELHVAQNNASVIYNSRSYSEADRIEALKRFMRDIESLARRAKYRLNNRKFYFMQAKSAGQIEQMADAISQHTSIFKRDTELVVSLLQRNN